MVLPGATRVLVEKNYGAVRSRPETTMTTNDLFACHAQLMEQMVDFIYSIVHMQILCMY